MGEPTKISDGAAAACERLDALTASGPELGRWMLQLARDLAARSVRRRTPSGRFKTARQRK
jgi:hypothetical protein